MIVAGAAHLFFSLRAGHLSEKDIISVTSHILGGIGLLAARDAGGKPPEPPPPKPSTRVEDRN